jgi:hypothetical protein
MHGEAKYGSFARQRNREAKLCVTCPPNARLFELRLTTLTVSFNQSIASDCNATTKATLYH